MTLKDKLHFYIRGWFPKEPYFPSTITAQTNQKTSHHPKIVVYVAIFVGVFVTVFLTMLVTYGLGLGDNYVTVAGATASVMATIVVGVLLRKPSQNKPLTEGKRRAAKTITKANAGMVCVFLGTYFLVNPNIKSVELTLGLWIILLLSMFLVNNLLYRNFKKQTQFNGEL